MDDDSDYTSADSLDSVDAGKKGDDKEFSDYESIWDEEIRAAEELAIELPITDSEAAAAAAAASLHNKKKKSRKLSIKNAFRRGRNANKALDDLRRLLEEAIQSDLLIGRPNSGEIIGDREKEKEISMWGIPLLPSKGHDGTDAILLKFLKARDWKVGEAYDMLHRTLVWRRRERIDGILSEDLPIGTAAEKMVYSDGTDREGRPVCFNLFGTLSDADFYKEVFGTERSREEFLRWRIQFLERIIRTKFKFKPPENGESDGVGHTVSLVQISDLKNAPVKGVTDLLSTGKKLLSLFQEYYPDIVYRNIIINVPSWFNTIHAFLGQHCSAGTRKKFVVARPSRVTSRLLKYMEPENIPVQFGGLKQRDDEEFPPDDGYVLGTVIKGGQHGKIEIPAIEPHVTIMWDVMVVGWDVIYKEEFVPDDEGLYKVQLQREGRIAATVRNSFYISEPGKIVITIKNSHFRKKRVFWRYKCKFTLPAYVHNEIQNS